MLNFDDILLELSYRVPEGIVDLRKPVHLYELRRILKDNGVDDPAPYIVVAEYYFTKLEETVKKSKKKDTKNKGEEENASKVKDLLRQMIVNPETDNTIYVSSALTYDKKSPVYQAAAKLMQNAGIDPDTIDKESEKEKKTKKDTDTTIKDLEKKKQLTPAQQKELEKARKERDSRLTPAELASNAERAQKTSTTTADTSEKTNPNSGRTIAELRSEALKEIEEEADIGEKTNDQMATHYGGEPWTAQSYGTGVKMPERYTDKEWKETKPSTYRRSDTFKFDKKTRQELTDKGFPEKYIQLLERLIVTQAKGTQPPITEFIDRGGAGAIQAQAGEVMAMMFISMKPEDRENLKELLMSESRKTKLEIAEKKNKNLYNNLKKKGLIDDKGKPVPGKEKALDKALEDVQCCINPDWIEAASNQASAFDAAMDEKYGRGQWRLEGSAWDVPGDIQRMGLDYKDKGFSTDVMLRVQPLDEKGKPEGKPSAQKMSLKKDEKIFFFNGSTNEVNNFSLQYLEDNERRRVRGLEVVNAKAKADCKSESASPTCEKDKQSALELLKKRYCGNQECSSGQVIKAASNEIRQLRDKAYDRAPENVKQMLNTVNEFPGKQTQSSTNMAHDVVGDTSLSDNVLKNVVVSAASPKMSKGETAKDAANIRIAPKEAKFAMEAYKVVKKCSQKHSADAKAMESCIRAVYDNDKKYNKAIVMAMKVVANSPTEEAKDAKAMLKEHFRIGEEAGNRVLEEMINPKNKPLNTGLREKLAEAFPIKTIMDGEEFMAIGGIKITSETLKSVFGVNSYEDLQSNIKLKKLPDGTFMLVYSVKGTGKEIPIGIVKARQKGKGYEGTVGFEIACTDEFALACAEKNEKNGDKSGANQHAKNRIKQKMTDPTDSDEDTEEDEEA